MATTAFRKTDIKAMVEIAVSAALIAVCAWITIPLPAVQFTMQIFGVFFVLRLLGGKKGSIAIAVYILLGIIGVPVFSGFSGGLSAILSPTGGYIAGFLIMGILYWCTEKIRTKPLYDYAVLVAGLFLCYLFGTVWFVTVYTRDSGEIGFITALSWCVFPFIIPDLIKLWLAAFVAGRVKKALGDRI